MRGRVQDRAQFSGQCNPPWNRHTYPPVGTAQLYAGVGDMNGKTNKPGGKAPPSVDYNDPDAQNAEQAETGSQAQDVADDALRSQLDTAEESVHGGKTNPAQLIPDDVPDLVDKMNEMRRSGRIDMDAYLGEEKMDDEGKRRS